MTKKDRELFARALRTIQANFRNVKGNQKVLAARFDELELSVKGLLLAVQETQRQQLASSGRLRLIKNGTITTPAPSSRPRGPRNRDR
jgi:hypothetical protein